MVLNLKLVGKQLIAVLMKARIDKIKGQLYVQTQTSQLPQATLLSAHITDQMAACLTKSAESNVYVSVNVVKFPHVRTRQLYLINITVSLSAAGVTSHHWVTYKMGKLSVSNDKAQIDPKVYETN